VTVTLIAEVGPGPSAPTGTRHPDRSSTGSGLGGAYTSTMPVRLRRPPASEPPYDPTFSGVSLPARRTIRPDGFGPAHGSANPPAAVPGITGAGVAGTSVAGTSVARAGAAGSGVASAGGVPPVAASAQRYVRICLEVLNGFRPASHLRTLAGPVEFSTVVSQLSRRRNGRGHFTQTPDPAIAGTGAPANRRAAPSTATPRNAGPTAAASSPTTVNVVGWCAPTSTARRNAPGAAQPFRLLRMRLSEPRDGVAEIVAVLSYAGSSLAMALRLERHGDQWLCALVQVI
jgi:Family of unknown function (DUF6459)